jgi:hypothetical protein
MVKNERADLRGIGSKEKHLTAKSKRFFIPQYKQFPHSHQCKYCGSDYIRFSSNGFCQRCQQRVEYVIREHPVIAARARGAKR